MSPAVPMPPKSFVSLTIWGAFDGSPRRGGANCSRRSRRRWCREICWAGAGQWRRRRKRHSSETNAADCRAAGWHCPVCGRTSTLGEPRERPCPRCIRRSRIDYDRWDDLGRRWPGQVVSINWGPWNEGMVVDPSRDLRWAYAQAGLQLIPVPEGIEACLNELRLGRGASSEVLIAASVERLIEISQGH